MHEALRFVTDHYWQATRLLATGTGSITARLGQAAQQIRPVLPDDLPDGDLRARHRHLCERLATARPSLSEREAATLAASVCELTSDLAEALNDW